MLMSIDGVSHYDMAHFPQTWPVVTKQAIKSIAMEEHKA